MAGLGGSHDRRGHSRLMQEPGEGNLRGGHAALVRDLDHAFYYVEVGRLVVQVVGELVAAGARRQPIALARAGARQHTPRERTPRDHADPLLDALRDHLPLLLAVDEVVMVLHRDETSPAAQLGDMLGLGELPGEHAAGADVASLASAHYVMQCLHGLLDWRAAVPAMDLIEVDVVHTQALQRGVDRTENVLARQAAAVLSRSHRHEHLRGDDELLAREELAEQATRGDLARAPRIGVGRVEERDAALAGRPYDRLGGVLVDHPRPVAVVAEAHHAQADARNPQACRADVHVLHRLPPGFLGSRMVAGPLADARMIGRPVRRRDLMCPMPQKTMTARPRRPPAFMARWASAARAGGYSAATRSAMRPSEAISRRSSSQAVRSRTVRTATWWIWMSRSVGMSSQPRTTAIAPPSRIAAKAARPSNAVSKRPSTPPGTTSRTARTKPSPRGTTALVPKLRTSASSSGLASAITRSPPALASAIT